MFNPLRSRQVWLWLLLSSFVPGSAIAQSIIPATDGTNTQITVDGEQINIHGGQLSRDRANLFHSFQEFGLSANQIANFLSQPGIDNIFGRVTGGNPSVINGILQVTGGNSNLYLMNPSGLVFGAQAQLNVPGDFVATTATGIGFDSGQWFDAIGTANYAALVGKPETFAFDGVQGSAIATAANLHVNSGQEILLLGGQTVNTGTLTAEQGRITIAAVPGANLVRISQADHLLSLELEPPRTVEGDIAAIAPIDLPQLLTGSGVETGLNVTGEGTIQLTQTGEVLPNLAATNILSGSVSAAEVTVLGDRVGLFNAQIDASGVKGGGNVRIGGDYRGADHVMSAIATFVDENSVIQADAIASGDGGRVIIWSEDTTRFFGAIRATGIENGGFVEVSGKRSLVFPDLSTVEVSGQAGEAGKLLLDPENIRVIAGSLGPNDSDFFALDGEIFAFDGPSEFVISTIALDSFLTGGNDVFLEATNNIVFETPFLAGMIVGSLELDAGGQIITQTIDLTSLGGDDIIMTADRGITINGYLATNGEIDLYSEGTIRVTGVNGLGNSLQSDEAVTITHGGGFFGLPFVVGDASRNGTTGAIAADGDIILPTQSFDADFVLGNITIDEISDFEDCDLLFCGEFDDDDEAFFEDEFGDFFLLDDEFTEDADFEDLDSDFSQDFVDFFELEEAPTTTVENTQTTLQNVESITGKRPAILYITYGSNRTVPPVAIAPPLASGMFTSAQKSERAWDKIPVSTTPETLWTFNAQGQAEIARTSAQRESNFDTLELILVPPEGDPIRRRVPNATRGQVEEISRQFKRSLNPFASADSVLRPAQQLYDWMIAPIKQELEALEIQHISIIADAGLRLLPFSALHDGDRYLIEQYSLGLMPSVALTDFTYTNIQNAPVLAMGATTFPDQPELPAVPLELEVVSQQFRSGEVFLNEAFTVENLRSARRVQPYPIIHLATHGEFTSGEPSNSYIELWRDRLPLDQIRDLELYDPPVELLVLSACRTALGDTDAELGFAGLAVASGAKTAVGSLWYVSDQGTLSLMAAFYEQLNQAPTRAEALRQAQLALLRGEANVQDGVLTTTRSRFPLGNRLVFINNLDLSHPYYWSAFTLIGSPW